MRELNARRMVLLFVPIIVFTVAKEIIGQRQIPAPGQPPNAQIQKNDTGVFDPQNKVPVSYSDDQFQLAINAEGQPLQASIRKKGLSIKLVQLPDQMAQANEIRRVGPNTAVVLGMMNGDVFDVALIDLQRLIVSDTFACYFPTISPDGHYIAFIKFSVAHPDGAVEDHYMLYDTTKSSSANRPPGVLPQNWMTVGVTMYPPGIGNKPLDNYGHDDHAAASTTFFWNPYDEKVLFADRSHDVISLVLVTPDLTNNIRARTVEIPFTDPCQKEGATPRGNCLANLTKADFDKDPAGSVTVVFSGVGVDAGLSAKTYKFKYGQFR